MLQPHKNYKTSYALLDMIVNDVTCEGGQIITKRISDWLRLESG